jgi:hypothetical protein
MVGEIAARRVLRLTLLGPEIVEALLDGALRPALAGHCAWLGAYVDRDSFVARDLHPLLLAGLPTLRERDVPKIHFSAAAPNGSVDP